MKNTVKIIVSKKIFFFYWYLWKFGGIKYKLQYNHSLKKGYISNISTIVQKYASAFENSN